MINLRKQFDEMIDIDGEYNWIIVRHNTNSKCNCWRKESNTPDPQCPNCDGGGWIFKERLEKCRIVLASTFRGVAHTHDFDYGRTYSQNFTVYLKATKSNLAIKENDLMFSVSSTLDGKIVEPLQRERKLIVIDRLDFRSSNNKVEIIKILAKPMAA